MADKSNSEIEEFYQTTKHRNRRVNPCFMTGKECVHTEVDVEEFYQIIKQRHKRINPCFMTGKGCVHTEHIDDEWEKNKANEKFLCFMVRPFRPNIEAFFELCLKRYLLENYKIYENETEKKLRIEQADRIRRTGYVVCEKICRRIQSVDFVIVDVSAPNANVFYELGLAYGIEQKILVIHQKKSSFGRKVADYLADAGCRAYAYEDLNPISKNDYQLSNYIWEQQDADTAKARIKPTMLLIARQYGFLANAIKEEGKQNNSAKTASNQDKSEIKLVEELLGPPDILLDFEAHIKAAVGVAVANIVNDLKESDVRTIPKPYHKVVEGLVTPDEVKKEAGFREVKQQLDQAYCTIIHTGGETAEPMAYFWLGYCHALGKNVIPVTVIKNPEDNIDDLAFDIRALWHMTFLNSNPTRFVEELQDTLQHMILSDFSEWSRRQFWDEIIDKRGRVSIFTGALHNDPLGRDMIADWDLRAASELTSFFASHQYRATIESPVYQIEHLTQKKGAELSISEKEYIDALEKMLKGKNCVIIASPDVNPLTEILLGKLYELEKTNWFRTITNPEKIAGGVVAFKEVDSHEKVKGKQLDKEKIENHVDRAFYKDIRLDKPRKKGQKLKRGFIGHGVPKQNLEGEFLSQKNTIGMFKVPAHIVIAKNPFDDEEEERHYIIILNGVSGPATFALTHVLTGGTSTQFVAYPESFDPNINSEAFLQQVNYDMDRLKEDNIQGVQYFIEVEVDGHPVEEKEAPAFFDWRSIKKWERLGEAPGYIFAQGRGRRIEKENNI
jgi:hypothetical protein